MSSSVSEGSVFDGIMTVAVDIYDLAMAMGFYRAGIARLAVEVRATGCTVL